MPVIEEIGTGAAGSVTSTAIVELVKYLKNAAQSEKNLQCLITDLTDMEGILCDIRIQFEDQGKTLPPLLQNRLESVNSTLQELKDLIDRAKQQRRRCLGCWLFCYPMLPAEISDWKARVDRLPQQLKDDLAMAADTMKILESAPSRSPPRSEVLLQPLPESGFVGSGVEAAHTQLITWLNEPNPQARVIGVYGMAGVGKTALLRRVHNSYQEKKEVSGIFDSVIWLTVSQKYEFKDLQASIAKTLDLDLKEFPDIDSRRMKLSASLGNKIFLLILDDVWRHIKLDELGVEFGSHNQSKVLISSRHRDVVEIMAKNIDYCKMIQPLSKDEGWELFRRRAFRSKTVRDKNLLDIATEVASECKGLPLAINAVAAALARKQTAEEWDRALGLMKTVDPSFPSNHKTIDVELYQPLRLSYDDLGDNQKMCFLYCAAFPEDAEIEVERLVEMWTAEGLVPQKGRTYFMDVGQDCIDALVDRCLLEYVSAESKETIKVHDVLRDMGIYIGEGEEKWLFSASQHLHNFPEVTTDCKRISLVDNDITDLPEDLRCPTLVSLLLARNPLEAIPERFLANFTCLKVLDLSRTKIRALPASVGELRQLQFLNLERCEKLQDLPDTVGELRQLQFLNLEMCIMLQDLPDTVGELRQLQFLNLNMCKMLEDLPRSICDLSHLQFLNLGYCERLHSLPDRIGELTNLKHLHFYAWGWRNINLIPQIYQLTSLTELVLRDFSPPLSTEDLSNLSNLIELDVVVEPEIKGASMSTWSEMRKLKLRFRWSEDGNRDDAPLDILPRNMQSMKKLQSLELDGYLGVSLPSCISQFQNLKYLSLYGCSELKELPALEIGSDAASGGFPMLETLALRFLDSLERIVWNEGTMLKLQSLEIVKCQVLQTFRMEELPNLRSLSISICRELESFTHTGRFPMLESLELSSLPNLESVAVSEETMPKLKSLYIDGCSLLRKLSMENLPHVRLIIISDCPQLEVDIGNLSMLKTLKLKGLKKLESIARSSSVWNEKTMPKLQKLWIKNCPLLRHLPVGMDTLPTLRKIVGELHWWEGIIWDDENVKTKLSQHFIEQYEFSDIDVGHSQRFYEQYELTYELTHDDEGPSQT